MTDPEPFIPPDPNEPIPQPPPESATDADAGGVEAEPDETEQDDAEVEAFATVLAAATTGAPTWSKAHALGKAQLARVVKGRERENVNPMTRWYYGNGTVAAWCFIYISWVLAHAAKTQSAGLALIGGKKAYVPYIRNISGYHSGHSGVKVGAIAAINSFGHIGFVTTISGSHFYLLSGNSTSGPSSDAVTSKEYPLSAINGYVNLKYAPAAPPNPNAYPGKVYRLASPMMHDSHVTWIQERLNAHGWDLSTDGQYGLKTADAVKVFQRHHGLTADGQVGPKTWAELAK